MKDTCKIEECVRPVSSRGLCNAHYLRHRSAGTLDEVADARFSQRRSGVHSLSEVDRESRTAVCALCGPVEIRVRASPRGCECMTTRRGYRDRPRPGEDTGLPGGIDAWRRWKYKITQAQLDRMLAASSGVCEICGTELDSSETRLDHCHETGEARGILCHRCNVGLGWFNDNPTRLLAAHFYLNAKGKSLAG